MESKLHPAALAREQLISDLRAIGEDAEYAKAIVGLTLSLEYGEPGATMRELRNRDIREIYAFLAIARRAGARFARFAELCDLIRLAALADRDYSVKQEEG